MGSQVRNDRRLRCPSLLLNGLDCVDDPSGQPFNGVGAVRRSASGNANQVSPLIPGVAATGSSLTQSLGWTGCPLSGHPSSLFPRAARAHLNSRCEPQVRGVADVASVTTSCSPGVRWTDVDLRHLSRPWAQDSFIAATIMSACPWATQGTGLLGCGTVALPQAECLSGQNLSACLRKGKHAPRRAHQRCTGMDCPLAGWI